MADKTTIIIEGKDKASAVFKKIAQAYASMESKVSKSSMAGAGMMGAVMGLPGMILGVMGTSLKIVTGGMSAILNVATKTIGLVVGVVRGAASAVLAVVSGVVRTITSIVGALVGVATRIAGVIVGIVAKATLAVGAAAAAMFAAIVYQGVKFERQMAEVWTLVSEQGQGEFAKLKSGVISIFRDLPTSLTGLTRGLYDTISAGITNADDALTVMREVSKAAIAGVSDAGTMGSAFMTVMQGFKIHASKAKDISDAFFATIKQGRLVANDLAQGLGFVAGMAGNMGIKYREALAAIAVATRTLRPEMAFVGMAQFLQALIKPADAAAKAIERMGLRFWKVGKNGKKTFVGLKNAIDQIIKLKLDPTQVAELFPEARAQRFVLALMAQRKEYNQIFADVKGASGTAKTAFDIIANTAGAQMQLAWNKVRAGGLSVWEEIKKAALPTLKLMNESIDRISDALDDALASKAWKDFSASAQTFLEGAANDVVLWLMDLPGHIDTATTKLAEWTKPVREAVDYLSRIDLTATAAKYGTAWATAQKSISEGAQRVRDWLIDTAAAAAKAMLGIGVSLLMGFQESLPQINSILAGIADQINTVAASLQWVLSAGIGAEIGHQKNIQRDQMGKADAAEKGSPEWKAAYKAWREAAQREKELTEQRKRLVEGGDIIDFKPIDVTVIPLARKLNELKKGVDQNAADLKKGKLPEAVDDLAKKIKDAANKIAPVMRPPAEAPPAAQPAAPPADDAPAEKPKRKRRRTIADVLRDRKRARIAKRKAEREGGAGPEPAIDGGDATEDQGGAPAAQPQRRNPARDIFTGRGRRRRRKRRRRDPLRYARKRRGGAEREPVEWEEVNDPETAARVRGEMEERMGGGAKELAQDKGAEMQRATDERQAAAAEKAAAMEESVAAAQEEAATNMERMADAAEKNAEQTEKLAATAKDRLATIEAALANAESQIAALAQPGG